MENHINAADLSAIARTWVGVSWHHQGRSRAGVDCAGLVECVLRDAGALPAEYAERANYGRLPLNDELLRAFERHCVPASEARPGTALTIRWPRMPGPSHVVICTGPTIVHAYRPTSGVVEHSYRGRWIRWTAGAWCLPGVTYE